MPDAAAQDDLDSPWKEVIEHAFPEFIDFYFPDASRQIDWAHGYTFLDKELQKIVRDGELGRRYVDKLVCVTTLAAPEKAQFDASTPSAAWFDCSTSATGPANASSTSSGCSTGCSSCPTRSSGNYGKILKTLKENAK